MKTYLLLRDNIESGPYNWEGLKQMELRTFDLIWINDESIVWKYPSEINEFKKFTGYTPVTSATRVNNLKERQIRFFREYITETDFRNIHLDEVGLPDAFVNDIPEGYEYLVIADNYNKYGGSVYVGSDDMDSTYLQEEDAITIVNELHNPDNEIIILGEKQKVDTPEMIADPDSFSSYFMHKEERQKNSSYITGKNHRRTKSFKRRNELYSLTIILGMIISSVSGYLK